MCVTIYVAADSASVETFSATSSTVFLFWKPDNNKTQRNLSGQSDFKPLNLERFQKKMCFAWSMHIRQCGDIDISEMKETRFIWQVPELLNAKAIVSKRPFWSLF